MPDDLPTNQPLPDEPADSWLARNRKFAILGSILTVLLVAAVVTYYLGRNDIAGNRNTATVTNSGDVNTSNRSVFHRYPAVIINDQDADGLTGEEEGRLGTKADLADSDGDGLTDREEVQVYGTDPLKQDTDGDGPNDGTEVAAGYDPKGPGTIRDLNQAIDQLTNQ